MKKITGFLVLLTGLAVSTIGYASSQYERDDTANLAAIKTSVETLDNAISGAGYNITQWGGTAVPGGSGTATAGSPRVVLATDVALPAGTNAIGKLSANSGVDIGDVDVTSIAAGNNNIGDVDAVQSGTWTVQPGNTANTTAWLVDNRTQTSGGASVYSASVTSVVSAKASAGRVYLIDVFNTTGAVAYLQVFDVASGSVTLGTTTPTYSIGVAASGKTTLAFPGGIDHGTAISVAGTTTRTGSSTAALDIVISYE